MYWQLSASPLCWIFQRFLGVNVPFEVQSLTGGSYTVVCELGGNPTLMTLMGSMDTVVCRIEMGIEQKYSAVKEQVAE